MCLQTVIKNQLNQTGTGYKVFSVLYRENGETYLTGDCISIRQERPVGQWLDAKDLRRMINFTIDYAPMI